MFTYADSMRLRVSMILLALIALPSALLVRGKANDPLQHVSWWSGEFHSAALVLSLSTVLGAAALYFANRRRVYRWGTFLLIGTAVGAFPSLFYSVATPARDMWWVPVGAMFIIGVFWGIVVGSLLFFILRREAA